MGKYVFTSEKQGYMTPAVIYNSILKLIGLEKFDMDVCCSEFNIPARYYCMKQGTFHFTDRLHVVEGNGLNTDWQKVCWMNPEFKYAEKWVKKAVQEVEKNNCEVWVIIPAWTETKYWRDYIFKNPNCFVVFLRKGTKFIEPESKKEMGVFKNGLAIVYFGNNAETYFKKWNEEQPLDGHAMRGF